MKPLIRLEHEGLLSEFPLGGLIVAGVDEQEAREVWAIRVAVEGHATRLAATEATEATHARLTQLAAAQRSQLASGGTIDVHALHHLNDQFHDLIYLSTGLTQLLELINTYRKRAINHLVYKVYRPSEIQRVVDEHESILDALRAREPDLSEALMRGHVVHAAQIVMERRASKAIHETAASHLVGT